MTTFTPMEWTHLAIGLAGGLSIMLYGIDTIGESLKVVAGDKMRVLMWRLTRNRIMALFTGGFVTVVMQSSTATTLLLLGFISARLMSLSQAIGVILGADIGTTLTTQLVAFNVNSWALLPVGLGFIISRVASRDTGRLSGQALMGVGLVFFGISLAGDSIQPLNGYQPFTDMMSHLTNPAIGLVVGIVVSAVMHSSAAAMAMLITFASQGFISMEAGLAITLGANIGTCFNAIYESYGKPRETVRAAMAHVMFKVIGAILVLPFLQYFGDLVLWLSPAASAGLTGTQALGQTIPRAVANAHTLFNVGITLLFLPIATPFARFLNYVIPDKPLTDGPLQPVFLDSFLLSTPTLALTAVRSELNHMGNEVCTMLDELMPALIRGGRQDLREVKAQDEDVDSLYGHIIQFLGEVSQLKLSDEQTQELTGLMYATHHIESIGDLIETNLVGLGYRRLDNNVVVSEKTERVIVTLHNVTTQALREALKAITELDRDAASRVLNLKRELHKLTDNAIKHQTQRLVANEKNRVPTFSVEMDIIEKYQRIYFHTRRLAHCALKILHAEEDEHEGGD